jgi:hypothetical protein
MAAGNRERAMTALNNLGEVSAERDDLAGAQYLFREAVSIAREIGAADSVAVYLLNLAAVEIRLGHLPEARALLAEGLAVATELGALPGVIQGIITHGLLAAAQGDHARALALWGLAQSHPACSEYLRRGCARYSAALDLDAASIAAGLARGAALDFAISVAELLGA